MTKSIKWIVQGNLIKPDVLQSFRTAFADLKIDFEEVKVIPFATSLPDFAPADVNIFYGSTTLMINAHRSAQFRSGVFYDPATFTSENYLAQWADKMLNADGMVLTFREFVTSIVRQRSGWFIRPNADTKSFAGVTMSTEEIEDWYTKIAAMPDAEVTKDTIVFVSPQKNITREWRNFIVNGAIVDSSRYVLNGELSISRTDVPPEMITFVQQCCTQYTPADIFVMDIAETNNEFKIVECNCFNGTGFYSHDIKKIVHAVTGHIADAF